LKIVLIITLLSLSINSWARGTYQKPADFIAETFQGNTPKKEAIWLSGTVRETVTKILTHKPKGLRVRYWVHKQTSAWILEEIGKTEPITVGFVLNDKKVERVKVLVFRESRGDEVRHDFFTRQFQQASLNPDYKLNRHIDGITGATLSVRALTRLSRVALYLNEQRLAK